MSRGNRRKGRKSGVLASSKPKAKNEYNVGGQEADPSNPITSTDGSLKGRENQQGDSRNHQHPSRDKSNFWIALFTGVLTVLAVLQTYALLQTERALVTVESLAWESATKPLPEVPVYGVAEHTNITTIPPGDLRKTVAWPNRGGQRVPLTETDIAEIESGKIAVRVYGYVSYSDKFRALFGPTTIGYCFQYYPTKRSSGTSWLTCTEQGYNYTK